MRFDDDDNESAQRLLSEFASGRASSAPDEETVDRLLSERGLSLARVLSTPPPSSQKRQTMANGGALQLRGKPQQVPIATAREVVRLSDELNLDEEACLELWARVTDRRARRRLAQRLGLASNSLDADFYGAAQLLFYLDVECGLGALLETTRGALDARLDESRRRLLFRHVRRMVSQEEGLVDALCTGIKALSGSSWARTKERRRRASFLASTAANCLFTAFYELQMTPVEAKRILETVLDLSATIDEYDEWHARKYRAANAAKLSTADPLNLALDDQARMAARAAAAELPVTSQPASPHAGKLRLCRDVLILVVVQSLDPRAELRSRDGDAKDTRALSTPWRSEDEDLKEAALGPAFPNSLVGSIQSLETLVDNAEDQSPPRPARAVALAALALCSTIGDDGLLTSDAHRRLWKAISPNAGNCCHALSRYHALMRGACPTSGSLGDARNAYFEVVARLVEAVVEAVFVLEPRRQTPTTSTPRRRTSGGNEDDDVVSEQAADVIPVVVELVTNLAERYPAFAEGFFVLDAEEANYDAEPLFVRLLRAVNVVAKRKPQLGLVPYLDLLAAAARQSEHRAGLVRDLLGDDFASAGLSLREFFDKLQRYCAMLEDGERRYRDHRAAIHLKHQQQLLLHTPSSQYAAASPTLSAISVRTRQSPSAAALVELEQETMVVPVILLPLDADILRSIVVLVGSLCAPSRDHVEHICLAIAPSVGVDPFEALAHLARALLVLYLRDTDAVPLDLKGECLRSLAALCVNPDAARDVAAMWERSRALAGPEEPNNTTGMTTTQTDEATIVVVAAPHDLSAYALEPPPERILVARDAHAPPPVFAWPPEWRDPRSHHMSQRRLSGLQSGKGPSSSPLQSAEHSLHTGLGGMHDVRRANSAAAQDAARIVAGSPSAMPTVFSAAFSSGRAEFDLIAETRVGCYSATEGVLCLGKELVRQTETNGAPLLSEVSRLALVSFASRSVLLRCAAPASARRGIFLRRVNRWRLAARACDALVAIVRTYSPDTDDWRRDFSESVTATTSAGWVGNSQATNESVRTPTLDFFGGSSSSKKDMAVMASTKNPSTFNGGGTPRESSSAGGVSAGFAVVYDSLTRSGGLLRIVCELLASARDESEADDDDDEPNVENKFLETHRLTKAAAVLALSALSAGLPEKAVEFLREAREQHEARLAEKNEEIDSRGAGVSWWRARCELLSLELLTAVADVESNFVEACRVAARSERSSSRAARAIFSSACGPPLSLAALVTSVRSATIARTDDDQQQLEAARRRAQQAVSSPYVLDRPMTLDAVLSDKANDVQEVAFFEAGSKRGDSALLLVELAKRVASSNDSHAALAIDLLRRVAVVAASEGDDGRLRAALACFAEDNESSTRADFANRLRDDDDEDDEQYVDDGDKTRDTDFLAAFNRKASPRDLALQLLAETTGAGAEDHSIGHWLLGLDESAAPRGRDERGCLNALVDIAFSFIATLSGGEDDFGDSLESSQDLLDATPQVIVRQCRVAERGLDLLYRLAKARRTRSAAVEATASALGGSGLPRLVVGARLLSEAAASNPSAEEAAALNGAARAALDLAAVSTHAAKLPGVELSDLARDRARAAVFDVFLKVSKQRKQRRGPRLEGVFSLFAAALRSSQAALAMAADVRSLAISSGQYDDEEQRLLDSGIGERRAASVDLAIALSRFCVVAVGYARQEVVDWIEPKEHRLWEDENGDDEDATSERNNSPKRLVAAVATAALDALLERREADALTAEAAAHAAADACANLRAVTTADDPIDATDLEAIAAQIGEALLEHRDTQAMSSSSASEAYRGHLYVALAHVLGAIALTESPSPENNVVLNRRRRRGQDPGDDNDGGGLAAEYAEVYEGHAVTEAAWTRVCDDAAKATTPWVRLSAASALSAAACGAATRDATFLDDLLRGAGFAAASKSDTTRGSTILSSSDQMLPAIDAEDQSLAIQRIETTLSALLRLSSQRAGAHAIAERSCIHVIASDDRVFLWTDVSPRCLLLALEIVRQLLRQLPRHSRLQREARDLVKNRDRTLNKLLRDDGGGSGLSAARARTAYIGILASLDAPAPNNRGQLSVEASKRSSMLWNLLATVSSRAPYWPLPTSSAYGGDHHDLPPWHDDDGTWWMDIQPAEGSEEALRAASPAPSPVRARRGMNGTKWTQFDDDKLRCSANTWARLVDFARRQTKSPDFDTDTILAALSKATHLCRSAQQLCDADTLAARDLRVNASFVLEATLQTLADRFCGSADGGTEASRGDPALRHDCKLHSAKVLSALDQIAFANDDDDFGNRVKKRLVAALSLDS